KQRAQGRPGADCARRSRTPKRTGIPHAEAHGQRLRVQPRHPGLPRAMFDGLYVISPGSGLCCPRDRRDRLRPPSARVPAPGPHDCAVGCGASSSEQARLTPQASIATRATLRDDSRKRPSWRHGLRWNIVLVTVIVKSISENLYIPSEIRKYTEATKGCRPA